MEYEGVSGESWRLKRGSCRSIVCWDRVFGFEVLGSYRRFGGDVIIYFVFLKYSFGDCMVWRWRG